MKHRLLAFSLSSSLLAGTILGYGGAASAASNDTSLITRGDFLLTIDKQLELPLHNTSLELPKDVPGTSPYAHAIRVMKEHKVVKGYTDGTVRLNDALHKMEAYIMIARILGLDPAKAPEILQNDYGISFKKDVVSISEANDAIQRALVSDPIAIDLLAKSSEELGKQDSFKTVINQKTVMAMKEGHSGDNKEPLGFSLGIKTMYKNDNGFHMVLNSKLATPLPNGDTEMKFEQYLVPEGLFTKAQNPETGNEEWVKMSPMAEPFGELLQLKKDRVTYKQLMNNKYVFYHNLGNEMVSGQNTHKISFQGRFASMKEMMNVLNYATSNQKMTQDLLPESNTGDVTMSGTVWVDEETKLPVKILIKSNFLFDEFPDQPMRELKIEMWNSYVGFNQVNDITLPEEARKAKELE